MPNGWDKNWVRLCAAVDGFRARYGVWPTKARMFPAILDDLRNHVFDPAPLAQLESKLHQVGDNAAVYVFSRSECSNSLTLRRG